MAVCSSPVSASRGCNISNLHAEICPQSLMRFDPFIAYLSDYSINSMFELLFHHSSYSAVMCCWDLIPVESSWHLMMQDDNDQWSILCLFVQCVLTTLTLRRQQVYGTPQASGPVPLQKWYWLTPQSLYSSPPQHENWKTVWGWSN